MVSVTLLHQEGGAKLNTPMDQGKTALWYACQSSQLVKVRYLLKNGACTSASTILGETALMQACKRGHDRIVRELLKWQINLDQEDGNGNTALHHTARCGNQRITELLIKGGAQEVKNKYGLTAREEAGRYGKLQVFPCDPKCPRVQQERVRAYKLAATASIAQGKLEEFYQWQHRYQETEEELLTTTVKLPEDHPITKILQLPCGEKGYGRVSLNLAWKQKEVRLMTETMGIDHPMTKEYLSHMGWLAVDNGKYAMGIAVWKVLYEDIAEVLEEDMQRTRWKLEQVDMVTKALVRMQIPNPEIPWNTCNHEAKVVIRDILRLWEIQDKKRTAVPKNPSHHMRKYQEGMENIYHGIVSIFVLLNLHEQPHEDVEIGQIAQEIITSRLEDHQGNKPLTTLVREQVPIDERHDYSKIPKQDGGIRSIISLLQAGANPNQRNKNGQTMMHQAVQQMMHIENVVRVLDVSIRYEGYLDIPDNQGTTALQRLEERVAVWNTYPDNWKRDGSPITIANALRRYQQPKRLENLAKRVISSHPMQRKKAITILPERIREAMLLYRIPTIEESQQESSQIRCYHIPYRGPQPKIQDITSPEN